MQTNTYPTWGIKVATFTLSALVAASVVYWGFKIGWVGGQDASGAALPPVVVAPLQAADPQAVARVLGGGTGAQAVPSGAAVVATGSRYVLTGVVADPNRGGAALISVDGKAARPVRVGAAVDGTLVLQSVTGRRAVLAADAHAPAALTLELPAIGK